MKLIVDTNKIVACLLKDGKIRRILFLPFLELYTVQYAFEEIEKHKDVLLTKVSKSAFDLILFKAKLKVKSVGFSSKDEKYIQTAKKMANEFDPDDFPFIALALKLNAPIWTNDKKLIVHGLKSGTYLAVDTDAVEKLIRGKSLEEVRQELSKRYLSSSWRTP
ncbi:Nucleotide-binding protein, PIN domain protein [Ferroglobus placidus DSM 10642]|uniref:Nucleotide-binding protein, PIN domain protein n=1 Tax=Ferroglobus placidus (strain DSM 10642 / AEDII12DO) TaxID=589924 RepID=D3RWK1_FERPA|nr:PIN domain-containing protein [Ferroglobus placidus]ADC64864.1 Nucleotide-binding protein, PIN domain protein [Ferroglobus placidus DSM 10642]